jgi:hypothetical protein
MSSNGDVLVDSSGINNLSGTGNVYIQSVSGGVTIKDGGIKSKSSVTFSAYGNIDIRGNGLNPSDGTNQTGDVYLGSSTGVITVTDQGIGSQGHVYMQSYGDVLVETSGISTLSGTGDVAITSTIGGVTIQDGGIKSQGPVSISAAGNIGIRGNGLNPSDGTNQTGYVYLGSITGDITVTDQGIGSNSFVVLISNGDVLVESSGINNLSGTDIVYINSTIGGVTIKDGGVKSKGGVTVDASGNIDIRGNGLNPNDGTNQTGEVSLTSSDGAIIIADQGVGSNGNVTMTADSVVLSANIAALGKAVRISPYDTATTIRLGGDDALNILGLTNAEMNQISADTLVIGNPTTSSIQLTSAVDNANLNVALVTTPTTGTLSLVDALTVNSINLSRVGKFTPSISGTPSANVCKAYGPVSLGNTALVLPTLPDGLVVGDALTIVENLSTSLVDGTFLGLSEGNVLSGVDQSGRSMLCSISYVGTPANRGMNPLPNDIVLTITNVAAQISGKIGWRTNSTVGILNTAVALAGDATSAVSTLADGLYAFDILGNNYTVTPTKTTGKLNGVTALDVARISQHVGGTLPFTNPFDFIAADINKSNTLNTSDASTLQNALLNNPIALNLFKSSWRFVPTGTMFSTPYGSTAFWSFPEKRTYTDITGSQTNQDFDAVKVGDLVSPNVNPAMKPAPAVPVVFSVPDVTLTAGMTVEVPFRCEHFEDLVALQACFWFNPKVLALDAVLPVANMPLQAANFGTWDLAEGRLPMVWAVANAETKVGSPEMFKLRFRVLQGGYALSDVLSISQKDMEASAWHTDYRPERVELAYTPVTETQQRGESSTEGVGFELYQNEPNPFKDKTVINFHLPAAAATTLTVYDESGRVVFTQKGGYAKGYNAIMLDRTLLKTSGLMYYMLETETASATKKMIQMK